MGTKQTWIRWSQRAWAFHCYIVISVFGWIQVNLWFCKSPSFFSHVWELSSFAVFYLLNPKWRQKQNLFHAVSYGRDLEKLAFSILLDSGFLNTLCSLSFVPVISSLCSSLSCNFQPKAANTHYIFSSTIFLQSCWHTILIPNYHRWKL